MPRPPANNLHPTCMFCGAVVTEYVGVNLAGVRCRECQTSVTTERGTPPLVPSAPPVPPSLPTSPRRLAMAVGVDPERVGEWRLGRNQRLRIERRGPVLDIIEWDRDSVPYGEAEEHRYTFPEGEHHEAVFIILQRAADRRMMLNCMYELLDRGLLSYDYMAMKLRPMGVDRHQLMNAVDEWRRSRTPAPVPQSMPPTCQYCGGSGTVRGANGAELNCPGCRAPALVSLPPARPSRARRPKIKVDDEPEGPSRANRSINV